MFAFQIFSKSTHLLTRHTTKVWGEIAIIFSCSFACESIEWFLLDMLKIFMLNKSLPSFKKFYLLTKYY